MTAPSCDIFCRVIDNFGDIAVCWRLARELATTHGLAVRLWVDDLASFHHIAPAVDPRLPAQVLHNVTICPWSSAWTDPEPARIVIEAFACEPPMAYVEAMARCVRPPAWINLEYLSAESWVEDCHGLASPHPRLPLTRHFFFPGFTPRTGGLLRETGLDTLRSMVQRDPAGREQVWQTLGIASPAAGELAVSLFAYENPSLPSLLDAWSAGQRPLVCILPAGRPLAAAAHWAGRPLAPGNTVRRGALRLEVVAFMPQEDYDRLLWACDLNFVRGEDSFVGAQWARKPLVWHIYRQDDDAHRAKLDAFLARYEQGLRVPAATALRGLWHAWDRGAAMAEPWALFDANLPELQRHAEQWEETLAARPDLASNLLIFCKNLI